MPTYKQYPREGEVFELTLDGDRPENTPLGLVEASGHNPAGWEHNGTTVAGKQTRKFKLVKVGHQSNVAEAKGLLEAKHGPTPEGQWIMAFKDAYPQPDGRGPVGVADASWSYLSDNVVFPCLSVDGKLYLGSANLELEAFWRLLVSATEDN